MVGEFFIYEPGVFLDARWHFNWILSIHGLVVGNLFPEVDKGFNVFAQERLLCPCSVRCRDS